MSCYEYWGKILKISEALSKYDKYQIKNMPLEKILPLLDSVEEIAHAEIDFDSAKHILDNWKMDKALKIIRKFYVFVAEKLEIEKALEILESKDPWSTLRSFHFFKRYEKLIHNEESLAHFSQGDKVVFIGGGALPLTLILLNKFFRVKCVSIEIIPEIAELSLKVIDKLGLNSEIEVICGDETELSRLNYDVVMVAALAEPKDRVFKNIKRYVKDETKIIYRTYTGMRAILYAPVTEEVLLGFEMLDMVLPTGKVNNTSVLIKKLAT